MMHNVISPDGATVASQKTGDDPPILLVNGGFRDHRIRDHRIRDHRIRGPLVLAGFAVG